LAPKAVTLDDIEH